MDQTTTGTQADAGQAVTGTQQGTEQATQQAVQSAQQTQTQQQSAEKTPQIPAEVQAQLATLQRERDELEKQARYHQSRADQEANRVRALAGVQPQADPVAPYLKPYLDRGIAEEDAKFLAQRDYQTDQRFAALQGSITASQQIPLVMQQVYANAPHLFQNPKIQSAMEASLRQAAANGQAELVNAEYAFNIGAIEYVRGMGQQQQQVAQVQQTPQFASQFGPISGFSQSPTVQPQKAQIPAHIQAAKDAEAQALAARFGFNKQP